MASAVDTGQKIQDRAVRNAFAVAAEEITALQTGVFTSLSVSTSVTTPFLMSGSTAGTTSLQGGNSSTNGGSILVHGSTHANANQVHVRNGSTVVAGWDNSGNAWFGGAVSAGSLEVLYGAAFNRQVTITGSNGGNSAISVSAGELSVGTNAWTFGIANSVSPTSPNRTLTVTIGGTTYYIHAKTTND